MDSLLTLTDALGTLQLGMFDWEVEQMQQLLQLGFLRPTGWHDDGHPDWFSRTVWRLAAILQPVQNFHNSKQDGHARPRCMFADCYPIRDPADFKWL